LRADKCAARHISSLPQPELGFLSQFRSTRIELEAKPLEARTLETKALEEGKCVQGCSAYGASIEAQVRNRTCGFERRLILVGSRQDRTAGPKRA
jgi:hypothetical protein